MGYLLENVTFPKGTGLSLTWCLACCIRKGYSSLKSMMNLGLITKWDEGPKICEICIPLKYAGNHFKSVERCS